MKRLVLGLLATGALLSACSAGNQGGSGAGTTTDGGGPSNGGSPSNGGNASTGGSPSNGGSTGQFTDGGGGMGGMGGSPPVNPCGTECGPDELCDGIHKGLDDNCDGEVDEVCPCGAGQASSCFKGDPSYRDDEGCNPGTMYCSELGDWGPCMGGNHATDNCFAADPQGCHPINVVPFGTADLSSGAGNFDDNADAGSSAYTVTCPMGVTPCPAPSGSNYTPLQSGEYTVTYTKTVGGVPAECTFPLYVGAPGLRVELSWNFTSPSVDLDLHLKKPMSTLPWAIGGAEQDCGFANCKSYNFLPSQGLSAPNWFPAGNVPPDPVNWYEDPVFEANSCYFAPRGAGADWQDGMQGCHSPRLDLDNISCNPSLVDPQSSSFCAPENVNIDFPPKDQWIRIGVHHYSHSAAGNVLPNVKIFCHGALAADLGTAGFYDPEAPFTWNSSSDVDKMWLVADVLFREDECVKECIVSPLYLAPADSKLPVVLTPAQYEAANGNGPPYPPVP